MHRRVHLLATNVGAQERWGAVTSRPPRNFRVHSVKIQAMARQLVRSDDHRGRTNRPRVLL